MKIIVFFIQIEFHFFLLANMENRRVWAHNRQHISSEPWWRHQMETFSTLLALCEGNSPVTGEFPSQRPVMRSLDVFFDLHLNKRLSKQSRRWWFETPSRSLWRHCNVWGLSERLSYWELIENISRKFTYNGQWCRVAMFSLIYTWTNGWLNNRDAGDLRCHHAHYDITVCMGIEWEIELLGVDWEHLEKIHI